MTTTSADFRKDPKLAEECFGPSAVLVACESVDDMLTALDAVHGSLTGTLWTSPTDPDAPRALGALAARAGRVVVNGVPTGVEVCTSMVHGGPHPACNRPDTTAVGSFAIRRWCRPVCYQNTPDALLPEELREGNPLGIARRS
jgi:acyl-CoA reductase-like NAD-dependent aldehyde dehydrogenase